jgi:two-component system, response regulator
MARQGGAIHILMAEDDADDRLLIGEAFTEAGHHSRITAVPDGGELLRYLRREAKYADRDAYPAPDVVLLDLNMPRVDGREALHEIKSDPRLRGIPVIVLTTSNSPEDVENCYLEGANSYIVKPHNYAGLLDAANTIGRYWNDLVQLPRAVGAAAR